MIRMIIGSIFVILGIGAFIRSFSHSAISLSAYDKYGSILVVVTIGGLLIYFGRRAYRDAKIIKNLARHMDEYLRIPQVETNNDEFGDGSCILDIL